MSAKAPTTGGARMGYMRREGRHRAYVLPATLDDDLGEAQPGRGLEACVEPLELEPLGVVRAPAAATGRPGYAPGELLRL
jgi:hypothetical protein